MDLLQRDRVRGDVGSGPGKRRGARSNLRGRTDWRVHGRPQSDGQEVSRQPDEVLSFARALTSRGRILRLAGTLASGDPGHEGRDRGSGAYRRLTRVRFT